MKISKRSLLIVAHPDDEALWFSSILENIGKIIFCFHHVADRPDLTQGRLKNYNEYPKENIHNLQIDESVVFNKKNFEFPEETSYGIKVRHSGKAEKQYINNYSILIDKLMPFLSDVDQVFTHNPWGEYGNEEHIQVYRAIKSLQRESTFDIWFPSYFSNKSAGLMAKTLTRLHVEFFIEKTNQQLAYKLFEMYKKNECWTWFDNWTWPTEETFIKDTFNQDSEQNAYTKRLSLPFHLIRLKRPSPEPANRSIIDKIKSNIKMR
jgi:hypothetical protein